MRYLGIDYGSRKTGLALSDEAGIMGFPHAVVETSPKLVGELCTLIKKEGVETVVIGESLNFSGEENPVMKEARLFGNELAKQAGVSVAYESEVLTTAEARRSPEKEMKSRSPREQVNVDASAAALILTSYLSRTHG